MAKRFERDNVPLSRLSVLAAQLESIAASAPQQPPDPILCFDLLSEVVNAIQEESKVRTLFLSSFFSLSFRFLNSATTA